LTFCKKNLSIIPEESKSKLSEVNASITHKWVIQRDWAFFCEIMDKIQKMLKIIEIAVERPATDTKNHPLETLDFGQILLELNFS